MDESKLKWFQDARFGMFIHWGLYSLPGGEWRGERMSYIGEWLQSWFRIPSAEYDALAAHFNPTSFDAERWVLAAKNAGMRYIVYTAKHHEGFAMYRSAVDVFNIVDATPFRRDPLRELAAACARHDMKLGLYYSQDLDWHDPSGGDPGPDFPKNFGMSWGNDWDFPDRSTKRFEDYFRAKVLPQVRELLTDYGHISLMWFDCPVTISQQHCSELTTLVRDLQPSCLINTRVGHGLGDFSSMGDNQVPMRVMSGTWETPATLNDTWGYKHFDHAWKSPSDVLSILAGLASRNVNYLLNIGPESTGAFPAAAMEILDEIGGWMTENGSAIHGTRESPYRYPMEWGWITSRPKTLTEPARLYFILRDWPSKVLEVRGLLTKVTSASLLNSPQIPLTFDQTVTPDDALLRLILPAQRPASVKPVIAIDLEEEASVDARLRSQDGDIVILPADCARISAARTTSTATASMSPERVGAAGEMTESGGNPSVDHVGVIVNWTRGDDLLEWEFLVSVAGTYCVDIITSALYHSLDVDVRHTVHLELDGIVLPAVELRSVAEPGIESRYYPRSRARYGDITIAHQGVHRLTLHADFIDMAAGYGFTVASIELCRQS